MTVRYWRNRAAEVRKVGNMFTDLGTRAKLDEIASHYEQMADEREGSSKGESFAFDAGYTPRRG